MQPNCENYLFRCGHVDCGNAVNSLVETFTARHVCTNSTSVDLRIISIISEGEGDSHMIARRTPGKAGRPGGKGTRSEAGRRGDGRTPGIPAASVCWATSSRVWGDPAGLGGVGGAGEGGGGGEVGRGEGERGAGEFERPLLLIESGRIRQGAFYRIGC